MQQPIEQNRVALQLTAAMVYSTVFLWVLPLAALFGLGYGLADYLQYPVLDLGIGVHGLAAIVVDPVFATIFGTLLAAAIATLIFGAVWLRISMKSVVHKLHFGGHQAGHV